MIKKIINNRRLKCLLFILMFGLVSLYIGCNLFQVGAYNLPSYIVTKDSNLIDDLNYLGYDLTNQDVYNSYGRIDLSNDFNYESNQNDSNFAWKLLTMEENYTQYIKKQGQTSKSILELAQQIKNVKDAQSQEQKK